MSQHLHRNDIDALLYAERVAEAKARSAPGAKIVVQIGFDFMREPPPVRGISWERYPGTCRAHHQLLIDGKPNGAWVRACGHPTALRPYYVITSSGLELERKFRLLDEAKAALLQAEGLCQ